MVLRFVLCLLVFANTSFASAQLDTVQLDEVEVLGATFQRFSIGQDIKTIEVAGSQTLSDALEREPSIYFKNYGNGQLSTISFRGTSASHTNVLWHGIPVNYPSLGQTDFNQWPSWLLESVSLHPGGAGSLYGSGAIGGSVLLDTDPKEVNGYEALRRTEIRSFGGLFNGVKGGYQIGNWSGRTKLFSSFLKNDFEYDYDGEREIQRNASVLDYGLQQQFFFRHKPNRLTFLDAMYTVNDRDIQPNKISTNNKDHLLTENLRLALGHQVENQLGSFTVNAAWIRADQLYNGNDRTLTNQYATIVSFWRQLSDKIEMRFGSNVNLYSASANGYTKDFLDFQMDVFGGLTFRPLAIYSATLNLRQSLYAKSYPFTPSFGHELRLFKTAHNQLLLNQQLSFGYRYPTLNDRYWSPGGNSDLRPESSRTFESGFKHAYSQDNVWLKSAVSAYQTISKDWILWRPTSQGFWSPENLRDVAILGLEVSTKAEVKTRNTTQSIYGSYAFTKPTNSTGSNSGNQLPYTPYHSFNTGVSSAFRSGISVSADYDFTGLRYTTLDNTELQSVSGFGLLNLSARSEVSIGGMLLTTVCSVNNLANQSYENLINRAMPGRNYQISLTFSYSKNS